MENLPNLVLIHCITLNVLILFLSFNNHYVFIFELLWFWVQYIDWYLSFGIPYIFFLFVKSPILSLNFTVRYLFAFIVPLWHRYGYETETWSRSKANYRIRTFRRWWCSFLVSSLWIALHCKVYFKQTSLFHWENNQMEFCFSSIPSYE